MAKQGPPPTANFIIDTSYVNASSAIFSAIVAKVYLHDQGHPGETRELLKGMLQMSLSTGTVAVLALDGSRVFRDPSVTLPRALYYWADMLQSASLRLYVFLLLASSNGIAFDDVVSSLGLVTILALLNAAISCISAIIS